LIRARHGLAVCVVLAGCGGAGDTGEQVSPVRSAIHHGYRVSDPAVVALVQRRTRCDEADPAVVCSGVLIGERLVLTAAHCVPGLPSGDLEVRFDERPSADPGSYRGISASRVHPKYDREHDDHDLALVWLDTVAPAEPFSLPSSGLESLAVGRDARVVGFGEAGGEGGAPGEEREGMVSISAVGGMTLTYGPAVAMTCRGDSGGPVFVEVDGAWVLAGITTSGDAACERTGVAVRVDVHEADFVGPARASTNFPPAPSVTPENVCAGECASNGDCRRSRASPDAGGDVAVRSRGCELGPPARPPALPFALCGAVPFLRRRHRASRHSPRRPIAI
jgi:hypothetical protein